MYSVWVNTATVVVGGLIGTLLRGGIPEKYRKSITTALALCVFLIGASGALASGDFLQIIVSMVIGTAVGELLRIEDGLDRLGAWAQSKVSKNDSGFAAGFVNCTLLFCVGAMAVVGSLEAGLSNKPDTLLAKAALDGVSSIIFGSTFGISVIFAAIPLTIYQGGIALLSGVLAPYLSTELITQMSAVGSLLIIGLSINMLGMTKEKIRVGNMLPAILVPCIYMPVASWLTSLF